MRIEFDDSSFIEVNKNKDNTVFISIAAETIKNQKIINSVELTFDQFNELIKDISKPVKKSKKKKVEKQGDET